MMQRMTIALAGLLFLSYTGWTQPTSALEKYRRLQFPPKDENFAKGWQERVALEYEIINAADLRALRIALNDQDPFVRAIAARGLGILGDEGSAEALAELVKADKEYLVRIRAVESLGYLKKKPEVIQLAIKDRDNGVSWVAKLAADQLKSDTDYAEQLREAYATGIQREAMGTAKLGQPAPDFTARTSDGKPFRLSTILGKKPIALYFAAYDG
jgi:HEAT repeats